MTAAHADTAATGNQAAIQEQVATAVHQTATSSRLLSLPAELRNWIYELAFNCDAQSEIDLFTATPPSKNLLLTCRTIHSESHELYREAYRRFWTSNRFTFSVDRLTPCLTIEKHELGKKLDLVRSSDLERITALSMVVLLNRPCEQVLKSPVEQSETFTRIGDFWRQDTASISVMVEMVPAHFLYVFKYNERFRPYWLISAEKAREIAEQSRDWAGWDVASLREQIEHICLP